ncbi:MAG: ATP-grasp domain-containing protein [Elusimicrobiota bacterium]
MLKEFIDKKNDNKINVITLTERNGNHESGLYPSARKLKNACERRGFSFHPILIPGNSYVSDIDQNNPNIIIRNTKTKEVIELEPENTLVVIRGSVIHDQTISSLLTYLESKGLFVINNKDTIELCANKYNTAVKLMVAGIPTPRTCLVNNINELEEALEKVGNQFPIIVKTVKGSAGIGVSRIDSKESLKGVLQSLWKHRAKLLLQEFLESDFDIRSIVLDGKIIASMRRNKIDGDFRSNYSLGGEVEPYELSKEEQKVVLDTAKMSGAFFCGVDHMVIDNKPYVIEVNASPGSKGVQKATGINVIEELMDYISDKNNWKRQIKEIGYLEKLYLPEVEMKLDATADTGNGMYNVLEATNIKKIDNIVSFKTKGKKIVKKLQGTVNVNVGGIRDFVEKRYLVKFDVEFNGKKYKDITFTLDDRPEPLAPILLCRDFLVKVGVNVNPKLKFTLGEAKQFSEFRKMFL